MDIARLVMRKEWKTMLIITDANKSRERKGRKERKKIHTCVLERKKGHAGFDAMLG